MVFTKQLDDGSRKIMEIIEGWGYQNGELFYKTLYQFETFRNVLDEKGEIKKVEGKHRKMENISKALQRRMLENGVTSGELAVFLKKKEESPCSGSSS